MSGRLYLRSFPVYKGDKDTFTVMIEPVKGCNLGCMYCYSNNKSGDVITPDVFKQTIKSISNYINQSGFARTHLIWHGGEPLMAGLSFYRQAAAILKDFGLTAPHCRQFLQTNGLLLDRDYCRFFKDEDIAVGISLDGPADLHDRFRVTVGGAGTHEQVLRKIDLIEKEGLPAGFNAVLTRHNVGRESDLYGYFRGLGYDFGVNPLIPPLGKKDRSESFLQKGQYGTILCALFDQWVSTEEFRIGVSPLDRLLKAIISGRPCGCQHESSCIGTHLAVKPSGDVTICSRFETPVLGNLLQTPIQELFRSSPGETIRQRPDNLFECHSCENWPVCHGGCPHNVMTFNRSAYARDPFCQDYKMIFNHLRKHLNGLNRARTCHSNQ